MNPFGLIGHWFWIVFLLVGLANYRRASAQARERFAADPQRAEHAQRLLRQFALLMALPWLLMGAGIVVGGVPDIWHYFRPQDGHPWVLAWFATVAALQLAFTVWVFVSDGATTMVDYGLTGLLGNRRSPATARGIRWIAAGGPLFMALWLWLVVTMNAPLPHGR